jgi:SPP1 family predicted phage head-tail adaptor
MAQAGDLRDRVRFERLVAGQDIYGNTVNAWADLLTAWADILERPGREAVEAGRLESSRAATMRVRRSNATLAITAADRVQARGRVWNIRSIGDVGRARELLEMVIEVGVAA